MTTTAQDCKHCQKSSLSLLLLRPSPLANDAKLRPAGADKVTADAALVNPFVPPGLTQSKPVLRLLRAGYVHLYIPARDQSEEANKKNDKGANSQTDKNKGKDKSGSAKQGKNAGKAWHTWRVTEQADLLSEEHSMFANPGVSAVCSRIGHNVSGFKLIQIPDAHELMGQSIWLAFSANLWSTKLKKQNKANPQAMVEIKLGEAKAPAFKPDETSLRRQVLECNAGNYPVPMCAAPNRDGHEPPNPAPAFPFNSLVWDNGTQHMVATLQQAAAKHKLTAGHELAVVLPDPVGYAAELNALRLQRFELVKQAMARSEFAHPMGSLQMLDGLRQVVLDSKEARSFTAVSPVMSEGQFKLIMRTQPNPKGWPEGTRWEPLLTRHRGQTMAMGTHMGRVIFPDHAERAQRWAMEATKRNWERYRKYINEDLIRAEKNRIDEHFKAHHEAPLRQADADWWAAREFAAYNQYFALHFDDTEANRPGTAQAHSAGASYTQEVAISTTPQPLLKGPVLDRYMAELSANPTDQKAVMLRALAGNQSTVLKALHEYILGPQGTSSSGQSTYSANQEETSRTDKLHDLASGLLQRADANTVLGRHHIKYGWLLHAAYGAHTLVIVQSLAAGWAAKVAAAGVAAVGGKGPKGDALVGKLERTLMAQQAMMLAAESAAKGQRLEVPVRFKARVPLADAEAAHQKLTQAGHTLNTSEQQLRQAAHKNGTVLVDVVSTNLKLREMGGDVLAALRAGHADIALGAAVGSAAAGVPVVNLSRKQLAQLTTYQTTLAEKAAAAMREIAQGAKGGGLSLDGHIGLVALLLNGLAVYGTLRDNSQTILSDAGTFWAFADSSAGAIGGLAQVTHSAIGASVAARVGAQAAQKSLWVLGTGAAVSGAGAFGGIATAAGQLVKAARADDPNVSRLYVASGFSFGLQGTTNLIQFAGAFSEFMIARGSQRAIWFTGARVAAGAGRGLVALTGIGLTGWGLIFLAGGLILEVGVVLTTPDALQKHVQNSYFGKGGKPKDKYDTLAQEEQALRRMSDPLNQPSLDSDDVAGNMQTDPMMIAP